MTKQFPVKAAAESVGRSLGRGKQKLLQMFRNSNPSFAEQAANAKGVSPGQYPKPMVDVKIKVSRTFTVHILYQMSPTWTALDKKVGKTMNFEEHSADRLDMDMAIELGFPPVTRRESGERHVTVLGS